MFYNELLIRFGQLIFFFFKQLFQTSWLIYKCLYLWGFLIQLVRVSVKLIFELAYFLQMTCLLLLIVVFDLETTQNLKISKNHLSSLAFLLLHHSSIFLHSIPLDLSKLYSLKLVSQHKNRFSNLIYHFLILIFDSLKSLDRILVVRFQLVQLTFNIQFLLFKFSWINQKKINKFLKHRIHACLNSSEQDY